MSTFTPTSEQLEIINAACSGESLIIQAYAGASKTTTLRLIAEAMPTKKILYLAFNKGIVVDATSKMPPNVQCRTVHSIAYGNSKSNIIRKLQCKIYDAKQLVNHTNLTSFWAHDPKLEIKVELTALRLFGWAKHTAIRFMQSSDTTILPHHVYIDEKFKHLEVNGVRDQLVAAAKTIWELYLDTYNNVQIPHDVYLKLFAMSGIDLNYDVVMVDECQDVSPVMLNILKSQKTAQKIYVGDKFQKIYSFTGSIDITNIVECRTLYLTKSFRFGDQIAEIANRILTKIDEDIRPLIGNGTVNYIDKGSQPNAVLCRTNSKVLQEYISHKAKHPNAIINVSCDTTNVLEFAEALLELDLKGRTSYPLMRTFKTSKQFYSWLQITDEPLDIEIRHMSILCNKINPKVVVETLKNYKDHRSPDITISTAHKAKGLEWDTVLLSDDFPILTNDSKEELRLFYVALTRAKTNLNGMKQYR